MVVCAGCSEVVEDSNIICCLKCPREYHAACVEDKIGANGFMICGEIGCGDPNFSMPTGSDIEYRGLNRELVCILFPAVVKNVDKAVQCLGGIKNISQVYNQSSKKRLGLSFQPENPFVKKIYADNKKTSGVLLKIRVKKVKINNEVKREVISTDVVGRVNNIYKYESLGDFQYLPVSNSGPDDSLKCVVEDIIPSGLDTLDFIKDTPTTSLYIVPSSFTRSDRSMSYAYTDKRHSEKTGSPSGLEEVHNKSRTERGMPMSHRWDFNLTDDFPSEPNEYYTKKKDSKIEYKQSMKEEFDILKKCFEERPIWSLNLIRFTTKIRIASLKILVPCLAVYITGGPWKSLWVKYGFDPRKEPIALIYQTLDFRLRHTAGVHTMVTTRDQVVHYKSTERVRNMKRKNCAELPPSEDVLEGAVIFRPGMAPAQRQIIYQLCDIKVPEVERLVSEAQAIALHCHPKYGWLPAHSLQLCRDHISRYVKDTLLATHVEVLKYEDAEGVSSDEEDPGDEITNAMDES